MKRWVKAGIVGIFLYLVGLLLDYVLTCKILEVWFEACKEFWMVIVPAQILVSFFGPWFHVDSIIIQILTPFAFIIWAILIERIITGLIVGIKWLIKNKNNKIKVFTFKVKISILVSAVISLIGQISSGINLGFFLMFIFWTIIYSIVIILVWTAFQHDKLKEQNILPVNQNQFR